MGELYSRGGALRFHESDDARIAIPLLVVPQAGAAMRDAPAWLNVRHFREHDARPARGACAKMLEMPVVRSAVR